MIEGYDSQRWAELDQNLLEVARAGQQTTAMEFLGATQVRADLSQTMGAFQRE